MGNEGGRFVFAVRLVSRSHFVTNFESEFRFLALWNQADRMECIAKTSILLKLNAGDFRVSSGSLFTTFGVMSAGLKFMVFQSCTEGPLSGGIVNRVR